METESGTSQLFAEKLQQLRQWQKQQEMRLMEQHKRQSEIIRQEQEKIRDMFSRNSILHLKKDAVKSSTTPQKSHISPPVENKLLSSSTSPSQRLQRAQYLEKILREAVVNINQNRTVEISDKGLQSEESEDNRSNMDGVCSLSDTASEEEESDEEQNESRNTSGFASENIKEVAYGDSSAVTNDKSEEAIECKPTSYNERPISSLFGKKAKTFEELIRFQLTNDAVHDSGGDASSHNQPKHKFLKKRQGLQRYQSNNRATNTKHCKLQKSQNLKPTPDSNVVHQKTENLKDDSVKKKANGKLPPSCKQTVLPPQKKLTDRNLTLNKRNLNCAEPTQLQKSSNFIDGEKLSPMTDKNKLPNVNFLEISSTFQNKENIDSIKCVLEVQHQNKRDLLNTDDRNKTMKELPSPFPIESSFVLKVEELERKRKKEQEELTEFEVLEKAAEETSFCSSSSIVIKALQKRLWNSPFKHSVSGNHALASISEQNSDKNEIEKRNRLNYSSTAKQMTKQENNVNYTNANEKTQLPHCSSSENYFDQFWSEKECLTADKHEDKDEKVKNNKTEESFISDFDFHDSESWSEFDSDNGIDEKGDCESVPTSTSPTILTASSLMTSYFPMLKNRGKESHREDQRRISSEKKLKNVINKSAEIPSTEKLIEPIREKMAELEKAMQQFQMEKNTLAELNNQQKSALKKLEAEREAFFLQKREEEKKMQEYFDEEKRKIRKEKRLCSENLRSKLQNGNSEREEIKKLRKEIDELQKQVKHRETKLQSTQLRLKDRIQSLEAENESLKNELLAIERQRLEKWKISENQSSKILVKEQHTNVHQIESGNSQVRTGSKSSKCINKFGSVKDTEQERVPLVLNVQIQSPERDLSASSSFISITEDEESSSEDEEQHKEGDFQIDPHLSLIDRSVEILEETEHSDGTIERIYSDYAREIIYPNDTRKEISSDGHSVIVVFFNGDIKYILPDRRIVYFFAENETTNTTYPDGLQVYHFSNNQIEKHYPDGTKEIMFPDQSIKFLHPDGSEESILLDGTIIQIDPSGDRIMQFPNGQREIHNEHFKKREYPDGTAKFLYPDGRQETRYSNGRVRIKNKDGVLIQDEILEKTKRRTIATCPKEVYVRQQALSPTFFRFRPFV